MLAPRLKGERKKNMKFQLTVEEKTFKNDKGEDIGYLDCLAEICGETVRFYPKAEDKSLLKHLIKKVCEK